MSTPSPVPSRPPQGNRIGARTIVALIAAIVFGLVAYFFVRGQKPPTASTATESSPVAGAEEHAYLDNVAVSGLEVSRAENFLHQEVTTVSGDISNGGPRPLASVEVSIEFYDAMNQIAQRETRVLFGPPGPPIPSGDHREFEVAFDHVSSSWNMRTPVVKVTAVQFAPVK
jgi:hypothetical protein